MFVKQVDFSLRNLFLYWNKKKGRRKGLELAAFIPLTYQPQLLLLLKASRVITLVLLHGLLSFVFNHCHNIIHVADAAKGSLYPGGEPGRKMRRGTSDKLHPQK